MLMFVLVGCTSKSEEGGEDIDNEPALLAGAKVLTRPEEYDFSEAVGPCTENYYNVFSKWVMQFLYNAYRDDSLSGEQVSYIFTTEDHSDYMLLDTSNGSTFTTVNGDTKYYLYEAPRYYITSYTQASNTRTIVINKSDAWNWNTTSIEYDVKQFVDPATVISGNTYTIVEEDGENWSLADYYAKADAEEKIKSYYDVYHYSLNDEQAKKYPALGSKDYFFDSPYYHQTYHASGDAAVNYYQDALEYVTYMLVMGKKLSDDALQVHVTSPSNITVGTANTPIVTALANAKELYKREGNYIGLTQANMDDLRTFILTEVIGVTLDANGNVTTKDVFSVDINGSIVKFNRNYKAVVNNIIRYACTKAPIGQDENGHNITLDQNYPVADIVDYYGDYFSYDSEDEEEAFKNIEAAEYQSIIFYPNIEDLHKSLTDIQMIFEYYENPTTTKTMAQEIDIDVGFRFYDSATNIAHELGTTTINVKYSKNGYQPDTGYPFTELWAAYENGPEAEQYIDLLFSEEVQVNTQFASPQAITPEPENPLDVLIKHGKSTKLTISATSAAREYYSVVETDGVQHIILNQDKMSCDFIEVYFVVHKDNPNTCYSFKVGASCYFAPEYGE